MSYIDNRSDIDKEIESCYSQIEELRNRIKILEAEKEKESRIDNLAKQISTNVVNDSVKDSYPKYSNNSGLCDSAGNPSVGEDIDYLFNEVENGRIPLNHLDNTLDLGNGILIVPR